MLWPVFSLDHIPAVTQFWFYLQLDEGTEEQEDQVRNIGSDIFQSVNWRGWRVISWRHCYNLCAQCRGSTSDFFYLVISNQWAITSVGVTEEWKINNLDLFASLSMRISSKRPFTFDTGLCTEYLFMASYVPPTARNLSLYKQNKRQFLEGFIMFLPIGLLLFLLRVLPTTVVVLGFFCN